MASEHPVSTIGDVCYVTDGAHAKVDRQGHGALYLTSKNIGVGQLLLDKVDFITHEDYDGLFSNTARAQRRPVPGDVLMGIIGTFGNAYLYKESDHFGISSAVALLRPDREQLVPKYLYYVVTSNAFRNAHSAYKSGSVQGYTNIPTIKRLPIPIPSLPEQHAIAHILGTLDDKIELNRRMNETLEEMARAIFKSWFVDFDPVRAKAEGRGPCLPKHIADLFPDNFEESNMGEIPAGWCIQKLGELVELAYGKALKKENRRPGPIPVFGSNGQVGTHDEKLVAGPGIIVGRKGNPGIVTWVPTDFFPIDTTFYVIPKGECRSLYFLYYALRSQDLASLGADSAVPGLNRNLAYMSQAVTPKTRPLDAFDKMVRPIFEQIHHNDEESRTLAALRDMLLPKLISGELRVANAKQIIKEKTK